MPGDRADLGSGASCSRAHRFAIPCGQLGNPGDIRRCHRTNHTVLRYHTSLRCIRHLPKSNHRSCMSWYRRSLWNRRRNCYRSFLKSNCWTNSCRRVCCDEDSRSSQPADMQVIQSTAIDSSWNPFRLRHQGDHVLVIRERRSDSRITAYCLHFFGVAFRRIHTIRSTPRN